MNQPWMNDENRAHAATALSEHAVSALIAQVHELGARFAREWDAPEPLVALWLAEILADGVQLVRERLAGEAEAAGCDLGDVAAMFGVSRVSSYRRKAPSAADFREVVIDADRCETTIRLHLGDWMVEVSPRTESGSGVVGEPERDHDR